MTLSLDSTYPIAQLKALLSDCAKLDLSPLELAEILWIASQRSERIMMEQEAASSSASTPIQVVPFEESSITPSPSSGPPTSLPTAPIVTEPPKPQKQDEPAETALSVNIPAAVALRNRREIARSLRPLMRKVPSKIRQTIDEEATVLQIAENNTWSPVVKPEPERWLELAIVIEVTNLLEVWHEPIAEFQHLLARHGAFRDVRTWQLQSDDRGKPQLFLQTAAGLKGKPRSTRELMDTGGRRLILLLSDCTSQAWRSDEIPQLLQRWARQNPVTIGQLLPEQYWDRSALGLGYPVALRSRIPGALSRDWILEGLSRRRRRDLGAGLKLPVITIQPQSIGRWAQAMAAVGEQPITGMVLVLGSQSFAASPSVEAATPQLTAKQLVRQFRGTASAKAQELADMMAVLPVNWSVIRLIQKNWADPAQEMGALQLAEIFLSGLLRPILIAENQKGQSGAATQYDFVEGVRDVLLGAIPISEAREVGESIAEQIFRQLPQAVQDRVNVDIAQRFGAALSYFEAFLIPDLDWGEEAAAEVFPFARVTGQVLRRWGGNYAALAQSLEQNTWGQPGSIPPDVPEQDFPPLQVLDFETAQLVEPGDEVVEQWPAIETETFTVTTIKVEPSENALQPFEFETATVQLQGKWVIQKQAQQANRFIEVLSDQADVYLEMVAIPGGTFRMGSLTQETGCLDREGPQHEVTVPTFLMGRYPITQAQWQVVAETFRQVNRTLKANPSRFKGHNNPVEGVSWFDAVEFCDRLSRHTGQQYRLPSEAEWEYACRAGTITAFHYGKTITPELANYRHEESYKKAPTGKSPQETTSVGQYPANPWGLSDMHGNVWEWCTDHWHSNYEGAPTDGSAWLNETARKNVTRMIRGGSWSNFPKNCRSAYRFNLIPRPVNFSIGFRVVCIAPRILP